MWSITSNIFNLIKNFIDIINNKYCMVIGAKYDSSIMNDAHTRCPVDIVGLPAKIVWPIAFFLKKKAIFVWLLGRPLAGQLRGQLMKCTLYHNI